MLRAKTLLTGLIVVGVAVTVFALNADHEGFVPNPTDHSKQMLTTVSPAAGPSQAIAQLPKLALKQGDHQNVSTRERANHDRSRHKRNKRARAGGALRSSQRTGFD